MLPALLAQNSRAAGQLLSTAVPALLRLSQPLLSHQPAYSRAFSAEAAASAREDPETRVKKHLKVCPYCMASTKHAQGAFSTARTHQHNVGTFATLSRAGVQCCLVVPHILLKLGRANSHVCSVHLKATAVCYP